MSHNMPHNIVPQVRSCVSSVSLRVYDLRLVTCSSKSLFPCKSFAKGIFSAAMSCQSFICKIKYDTLISFKLIDLSSEVWFQWMHTLMCKSLIISFRRKVVHSVESCNKWISESISKVSEAYHFERPILHSVVGLYQVYVSVNSTLKHHG